jgi:hypothetical protein
MQSSRLMLSAMLGAAFVAGYFVRGGTAPESVALAQAASRVYELRTYTVPEDRLEPLHARFRNHTLRIFPKHGITNVVYFRPQDPEKAKTTMVYLISHASRQAADQNWAAFRKDPEWQKVAAESGVGQVKIASEFLEPTGYSPMK